LKKSFESLDSQKHSLKRMEFCRVGVSESTPPPLFQIVVQFRIHGVSILWQYFAIQ
jgi:hypothetical protein